MDSANEHEYPEATTTILAKEIDVEERKEEWNYRAMVGMLNFMVGLTMPEIAHVTHQCARFCKSPKDSHETAVNQIVRYLTSAKNSRECRLIMKPDTNNGLEIYVDASFAGDWNQSWIEEPTSVLSITGYVIKYANCPIVWMSKLQTEIALSTREVNM
eukprot:9929412-Ditylum_brightwellii.AAC.1